MRLVHQRRMIDLSITVSRAAVEVHVLHDLAEAVGASRIALVLTNVLGLGVGNLVNVIGRVLNVEDGLVGLDKGRKGLALAEGDALLVDGEVDVADDVFDDRPGVLETNGHVVLAGLVGEEAHVVDRVLSGEAAAVVIVLLKRVS